MNALVDARRRDEEDRKRQVEEDARRAEREAAEAKDREAAEARKREEDERRRQDDERKRRAEDEARRRLGEEAPRQSSAPAPAGRGPGSDRPRSDGPRPAGRFDGPRTGPRSDGPRTGGYGGQRSGGGTMGGRPPSLNHMARPAAPVAPDPETAKPNVRTVAPVAARAVVADEEEGARTIRRPGVAAKPAALPKTPKTAPGEEKRRGRLTLANATSGEDERTRSLASFRRRDRKSVV